MKILLLGADGQVGFELHRTLAPLAEVIPATITGRLPDASACGRSDLASMEATRALVREAGADWIVNAAAYTAVDKAEEELELAQRINADSLAVIADEAKKRGSAVLHFSTDYVFAGDATTPYRETDAVAPINAYGRTKLGGEQALRASGVKHIILRTAWVYGSRGHNFLLSMLKLATSRERLTVVDDQRGTPTPAKLLAAIAPLMLANLRDAAAEDPRWGTYHATAGGATTWHGFASEIVNDARRAGLLQRNIVVDPIASADFPTRAKRPGWSVLDCGKLCQTFGLQLPDWRNGLSACVAELAEMRGR